MRYISRYKNFGLLNASNEYKYQFQDGVLIVGSLTTNVGGGNAIDTTGLQELPSLAGETGLAKYGLNTLFWEAPELSVANTNATLVAGKQYVVIRGEITFAGKTYKAGTRIYVTSANAGAFTGTGVVSLDVPEEFYKPEHHDQRALHFVINNLERGDEAEYIDSDYDATISSFIGIRP